MHRSQLNMCSYRTSQLHSDRAGYLQQRRATQERVNAPPKIEYQMHSFSPIAPASLITAGIDGGQWEVQIYGF